MLLGNVLLALGSSLKQLKALRVRVSELPLTAPFLALEVFDEVQKVLKPPVRSSRRPCLPDIV